MRKKTKKKQVEETKENEKCPYCSEKQKDCLCWT